MSASSTSSCTADLLRGQAADLRCFINDLLDGSAQLQLESTTTIFRPRLRQDTQAKCQFTVKYFYGFNFFCKHALHDFLLFRSLPLDMLGGLEMLTRRSPDLRVQIFLSCAMFPSPSTCSGAWPCQSKGRHTCGVLLLLCVFFL
jgi:hypothetical protein